MWWLRRTFGAAAIVLLLVIVLVAGLFGAAQTRFGRDWIADMIADAASTPGSRVTIAGIEGLVPFSMTVREMSVADEEGTWLTVENLEIDWLASEILSRRLRLGLMEAERVRLERLPTFPADESPAGPAGPPSLPQLPLTLSLDRIAIERLEIGPAVAGEPITLAIHGDAALEPNRAAVTVAVRRLDGPEGRLDLRLVFAPEENRLEAKLEAVEPSGRIADRLLGRNDGRPVRVSLDGSGPIDDWSGRLTGMLGADAGLDLALTARGVPPYRLSVEGVVRPAPLLPPAWGELLAPGIRISGSVSGADGATVLEGLQVAAPGVTLAATGRLAEDGALSGRLDATVIDLAPFAAAAGQPASGAAVLGVDLDGTIEAPRIRVGLDGTDIAAAGVGVEILSLAADLRPAGNDITISAGGRVQGLELQGEPAPLRDAEWSVAGTVRTDGRTQIDALAVTTADGSVQATGTVDPAGPIDLQLSGQVPGALLERFGAPLHGPVALSGQATGDLASGAVAGNVTAEMRSPVGEPTLATLLGPSPRLSLEGRREADGTIRASTLRLEGRHLAVAGDATLSPAGTVAADLRASLSELAPLAPVAGTALSGQLAADVGLSGTLDRPAFRLRLSSPAIDAAGRRLRQLVLTAEGRVENAAVTVRTEGGVQLDGVPVELAASIRQQGDRTAVEDLRIDAAGQRLTGSAQLAGGQPTAATAQLAAPDLSRIAPLIGATAAGALDMTARLASSGNTLRLTADGTARNLSFAGNRVQNASLEARIDAPFTAPRGKLGVDARGAYVGGQVVDRLQFDAEGDLAREIRAKLSANSAKPQPLSLDLAATIARRGDALLATVTRGSGTIDRQTVTLGGPLRVQLAGEAVTAEGIDLRLGRGRMAGRARYAPGGLTGELEIQRLSLADLGRLAGVRGMQGQIDGEARIDTAAAAPSGTMSLRASGIRWRGTPRNLPPLTIVADGNWRDGRASLTAALRDVPDAALTLEASAPLRLASRPVGFVLPPDGAISGRADGNIDLARIRTYLPTETLTMAGRLDVALRLEGTVADPRPGGRATLAGARIEDGTTGIVLADLRAAVVGDGNRFRLETLAATDGAGGTIDGRGFAERGADGWGGEASVTAERFRVLANDLGRAIASGRIEARSTASGGRIAGNVRIDQGDITLPQSTPAALKPLPVVEINRPGEEDVAPAATSGTVPITLAVDVSLPGRLFVRGRGLDSEWRGDLRITGTIDAPQITGSIRTVRGRYDLLGRRFNVARGVIEFDGPPTDARLDLVATASTNQLEANVSVSGSVMHPTLKLGSNPPLPQDEVLAQVLFGRSTTQITPGQAVQLAQAAAELAGLGSGSGLVDRVRQTLGLDALDIGGDDGTSVTLGRYITDDVFVKVNPNPGENAAAVGVEIQVLPNVTVDAGVGGDGTSVGVKYRLDY